MDINVDAIRQVSRRDGMEVGLEVSEKDGHEVDSDLEVELENEARGGAAKEIIKTGANADTGKDQQMLG